MMAAPILLAEDKPSDADLFCGAFRKTGSHNPLHTVQRGEDAIDYLHGRGRFADRQLFPLPKLLVLDPNMPGKSGWEVLRWLGDRPEFASLVVIMLGGNGSQAEEDMAYRLGVNQYHLGVSTPEAFEKAVSRIVERWP